MIPLIYTWASITSVVVALLVDRYVLKTRLLSTRLFWASYGIILFFQLIVNGILTGFEVVQYEPAVITGLRIAYAPVEDIGFGFGLVCLTQAVWVKLTRSPSGAVGTAAHPNSSAPPQ